MNTPTSTPKDPDRLEAEETALQLAGRLGQDTPSLPTRLALASDDELRRILTALRREARAVARSVPEAKAQTLRLLQVRLGASAAGLDLWAVETQLAEELGLYVADDGLIEADRLLEPQRRLIGQLPVALFHHTASGVLASIQEHGLIVGKQTNYFNSQAGVYVSARRAGEPVAVYSRVAAARHGGEPMVLRVRRTLDQITPDPDDADLAWAQGVQFITRPPVPVDDLLDLCDQEQPAAAPRPAGG